jgi:hypothetical protein
VKFDDYQALSAVETSDPTLTYLYALQPVGQVIFVDKESSPTLQEHILTVAYPQPHEPIHQMAKVLGLYSEFNFSLHFFCLCLSLFP